ncbi:MAG: hypothetical protein QGI45_11190 [Myxococcota bacterium]|nr:hypothetical protein [Myxococcota bacterium]
MSKRQDGQGLTPPKANALGPDKRTKHHQSHDELQEHAQQVRKLNQGQDFIEAPTDKDVDKKGFEPDLLLVRSWLEKRPLEPVNKAAAMVPFPRQWATKRGRYCKFRAPGAGTYALIRARPTF